MFGFCKGYLSPKMRNKVFYVRHGISGYAAYARCFGRIGKRNKNLFKAELLCNYGAGKHAGARSDIARKRNLADKTFFRADGGNDFRGSQNSENHRKVVNRTFFFYVRGRKVYRNAKALYAVAAVFESGAKSLFRLANGVVG